MYFFPVAMVMSHWFPSLPEFILYHVDYTWLCVAIDIILFNSYLKSSFNLQMSWYQFLFSSNDYPDIVLFLFVFGKDFMWLRIRTIISTFPLWSKACKKMTKYAIMFFLHKMPSLLLHNGPVLLDPIRTRYVWLLSTKITMY